MLRITLLFVIPAIVGAFSASGIRTTRLSSSVTRIAAISPEKEFEVLAAAAVSVEASANGTVLSAALNGTTTTTKRSRKVNPRDLTGFNYRDADGEYDVPIVDEPMWFRMVVRKNSEKKFCDYFLEVKDKDPQWMDIIADAFYPQSSYVRFKGKGVTIATKPMVPGLIYVKTKMGPDIADDLESIKYVYGFTKNAAGLVLPLSHEEGLNLERMRERTGEDLDQEVLKMRRDEYVTVVEGRHKGRYGILMGAKSGRLEVCLRSDYKDEWDVFDARELRYLAQPPEKKWNELTAKEAVESLMAKDPRNPTLKSLRDQGVLEEILYPEGRPDRRSKFGDRDGAGRDGDRNKDRDFDYGFGGGGREGGRSVRSIAKPSDESSSIREPAFPTSATASASVPGVSRTVAAVDAAIDWDAEIEAALGGWNSAEKSAKSTTTTSSNTRPAEPSLSSSQSFEDEDEDVSAFTPASAESPAPLVYDPSASLARLESYGSEKPWKRPSANRNRGSFNERGRDAGFDDSWGADPAASTSSSSSSERRVWTPKDGKEYKAPGAVKKSAAAAASDDFDSFIKDLLDGLDTPSDNNKASSSSAGAGAGTTSRDRAYSSSSPSSSSFATSSSDDADRLDSESVLNDLLNDIGRAGSQDRSVGGGSQEKSYRSTRMENKRAMQSRREEPIDNLEDWATAAATAGNEDGGPRRGSERGGERGGAGVGVGGVSNKLWSSNTDLDYDLAQLLEGEDSDIDEVLGKFLSESDDDGNVDNDNDDGGDEDAFGGRGGGGGSEGKAGVKGGRAEAGYGTSNRFDDRTSSNNNNAAANAQPRGRTATGAGANKAAAGGLNSIANAPKMEDFGSFEEYLDALVSHERTAATQPRGERGGVSSSTSTSSRDGNRMRSAGANAGATAGSRSADASAGFVAPSARRSAAGGDDSIASGGFSGTGNSGATDAFDLELMDLLDEPAFKRPLNKENSNNNSNININSGSNQSVAPTVTGKEKITASVEATIRPPAKKPAENTVAASASSSNLSSMTVKELKERLKEKGLPVSGVKSELIERLSSE